MAIKMFIFGIYTYRLGCVNSSEKLASASVKDCCKTEN